MRSSRDDRLDVELVALYALNEGLPFVVVEEQRGLASILGVADGHAFGGAGDINATCNNATRPGRGAEILVFDGEAEGFLRHGTGVPFWDTRTSRIQSEGKGHPAQGDEGEAVILTSQIRVTDRFGQKPDLKPTSKLGKHGLILQIWSATYSYEPVVGTSDYNLLPKFYLSTKVAHN